jgi:hypothetical protein
MRRDEWHYVRRNGFVSADVVVVFRKNVWKYEWAMTKEVRSITFFLSRFILTDGANADHHAPGHAQPLFGGVEQPHGVNWRHGSFKGPIKHGEEAAVAVG